MPGRVTPVRDTEQQLRHAGKNDEALATALSSLLSNSQKKNRKKTPATKQMSAILEMLSY